VTVDGVLLGAVGSIVVGLVAAGAAVYGHRGTSRASETGAVLTGYGGLVAALQQERTDLHAQLAEAERRLAEAYAELARERADRAALEREIARLEGEVRALRARLGDEGGGAT
jgi:septal ring factor EnvC (AmiA/AmiB activator)